MKIASAAIAMDSQHTAATYSQTSETMRAWGGRERPDFERRHHGHERDEAAAPAPQISAAGQAAQSAEMKAIREAGDAAESDPILLLIRAMLEWMTGETVKLFDAGSLQPAPNAPPPPPAAARSAPQQQQQPAQRADYGVEYDYHQVYEEFEQTDFSASGTIQTADGKTIDFTLELSMSRQYRSETSVSVRAGDAMRRDPLVINFGGSAAQLSSQRFGFDLLGNGQELDLPLLGSGSGYLALDLNQNGTIDSGTELFGPSTGSGFAELAQYDEDGNGWIDENDAVFDRLAVWTPAAQGNGSLATLKERAVGALYLGRLDTPFELRGPDNQDLGAVRETGIYLTESGSVGSLQEIDLTV